MDSVAVAILDIDILYPQVVATVFRKDAVAGLAAAGGGSDREILEMAVASACQLDGVVVSEQSIGVNKCRPALSLEDNIMVRNNNRAGEYKISLRENNTPTNPSWKSVQGCVNFNIIGYSIAEIVSLGPASIQSVAGSNV